MRLLFQLELIRRKLTHEVDVITAGTATTMIPVDSLLLSLELARNTGDNSERHHTGISHSELHTVQNTAVRCCTPLGITTDPATSDTP